MPVAIITPQRTLPPLSGFAGSATGTYAVLTWDAFAVDFLTAEIEYRIPSEANWSGWPVAINANAARVGPLLIGYNYEFRARTRSDTTGRVGSWTTSEFLLIETQSWIKLGDGVAATADLDFENDRYFQRSASAYIPDATAMADILTFTRSTAAYSDNLAGVWSSFAIDVPRRTDKGLLIEEARTNEVRNNSFAGFVAGTPGTVPADWEIASSAGLTRTIVGTGTLNGIEYVDIRFAGTAAGSGTLAIKCNGSVYSPTVNGDNWAFSYWSALVAGSFSGFTDAHVDLNEYTSAPSLVATNSSTVSFPGGSLSRQQALLTITHAATTQVLQYLYFDHGSGALDVTFRIGWPQLELGYRPSSPIRTAGATAARSADHAALTTLPALGAAFSLYGKGTSISVDFDELGWVDNVTFWAAIEDGSLTDIGDLADPLDDTVDMGDLSGGVSVSTELGDLGELDWTDNVTFWAAIEDGSLTDIGDLADPIDDTADMGDLSYGVGVSTELGDLGELDWTDNVAFWAAIEDGSITDIGDLADPVDDVVDMGDLSYGVSVSTDLGELLDGSSAAAQVLTAFTDATGANRFNLRRDAAIGTVVLSAGGTTASINGSAWASGASLAAAYAVGSQALSMNGTAAVTAASVLLPTGLDRAPIGENPTGLLQFNGYVERVAYWPTYRIGDAGLATLSA